MSTGKSYSRTLDSPNSIDALLEPHYRQTPTADAVVSPVRPPLSYRRLVEQISFVAKKLGEIGVARRERIAIVLPGGAEMDVAFLGVAGYGVSAPLNPTYRAEEFTFYFSALRAQTLIVQAGHDTAARAVAESHGIRIIELSPTLEAEAGTFTLAAISPGVSTEPGDSDALGVSEKTALLLHTSGTTSRPKIVPLTEANLCASARHIVATLKLSNADRCLNVMPLFHIHGLVAAVLSSLAAGGSVVCTPAFYAPQFFDWVREFRPTWYTAVPTMHQAILARAKQHEDVIAARPLRLIRSSSAALPPQVLREMEEVFRAPVVEAYGMTEAAHQMASNPLPPGVRKVGSVGPAAGPEVALMDERGELLPRGQRGEIVVRGDNVMSGYENNFAANEAAYSGGWLRTGDEGMLDEDGYLFLTGRLKEMINRGGEKIAPREIDEVLLSHPAIAQAVTFPIPHAQLGEDVAAAVVLKESHSATGGELGEFAAARLADFKVPRRFVFLNELPKGATGKLQRIGLAGRLGLTATTDHAAPTSPREYLPPRGGLEEALADICREVLGVELVGAHDNFFQLGGDSILAAQFLARVRAQTGVELPLRAMFESSTVAELAVLIAGKSQ